MSDLMMNANYKTVRQRIRFSYNFSLNRKVSDRSCGRATLIGIAIKFV